MGRVKRICYLSSMRAAKVQASLRIRAVSPEPPLLAHTSSESRGTFRQKARSLAPLNGCACAFKICHDGMLKDTNSLDEQHIIRLYYLRENHLRVVILKQSISRWTNVAYRLLPTDNIPVFVTMNYFVNYSRTNSKGGAIGPFAWRQLLLNIILYQLQCLWRHILITLFITS